MRGRTIIVVPPFCSVVRPSLGPSLLLAALRKSNSQAYIQYANMEFAEIIGSEFNEWICHSNTRWLLGEWIFSSCLYAESPDSQIADEYVTTILSELPGHLVSLILRARILAQSFVDSLARDIVYRNPLIVGFSSCFQQNCAALSIARKIKEYNPTITICLGGANCEGVMGETLASTFRQLDYVFSGEADHNFPRFTAGLLGKAASLGRNKLRMIGTTVANVFRSESLLELDSTQYPDYEDYFRTLERMEYRCNVQPGLLFETSRGCWWGAKHHCTFCGLNGNGMIYRSKSPTRIVRELKYLTNKWGVFRIEAVDNILNPKHIDEVFAALAHADHGYKMFFEVKSNLQREQLITAAKGGVTWVQPGIESLDSDILRLMDKGVSSLQNIRFLRNCSEIGIRPIWNVLYGFPGERPEQYSAMCEVVGLVEHLFPPSGCHPIRLDRFSPYFERGYDYGISDITPLPVYKYIYYKESRNIAAGLAYFFDGVPIRLGLDDYTAGFRKAVENWKARFYNSKDAPVLAMLPFGRFRVVKDTRSCSSEQALVLSESEWKVLELFANPSTISSARSRAPRLTKATSIQNVVNKLVRRGLILCDKDHAVSLVVEHGFRVNNPERLREFPGGYLNDYGLQETQTLAPSSADAV